VNSPKKFRSLRSKLIFAFFTIVCLSLLVVGFSYYHNMSRELQNNTNEGLERLTAQVVGNLETQMITIQRQAWGYFSDTDLQNLIMQLSEKDNNARQQYYRDQMESSLYMNPALSVIYVSDLDGKHLSSRVTQPRSIEERDERETERMTLLKLATDQNGTGFWTSMRSLAATVEPGVGTIGYIQQLKKITHTSQKGIGMLQFEMDESWVREILKGVRMSEHVAFAIIDGNDRLLLGEGDDSEQLLNKPLNEWIAKVAVVDKNEGVITVDGSKYLAVRTPFSLTDWQMIGIVPQAVSMQGVGKARTEALTISAISLIVTMFVSIIIASRVTEPLNRLRLGMRQVRNGNFNVKVPVATQDEIGFLGQGFNTMTAEIHRLITKVYEEELLKKEADFKALQSQINPHFLYNALGAIDSVAAIHDDHRISHICKGLASMFRYSISEGTTATIRDEIRQIELYLSIQKIRYGNRLESSIELDPLIEEECIPKLLLQPLVENAVVHGIETKRQGGGVWVTATRITTDKLMITVKDNGGGIPEELIANLHNRMKKPSKRSDMHDVSLHNGTEVLQEGRRTSIGLVNVYNRVQLHYEGQAVMTLESEEGKGTFICIEAPIGYRR